jgi:hypothetical protein
MMKSATIVSVFAIAQLLWAKRDAIALHCGMFALDRVSPVLLNE